MTGYLLLLLMGGIGVSLRYWLGQSLAGGVFPLATLLVNVFGSFVIGFVYGYHQQISHNVSPMMIMAITVGLLGALTTFSSFSLDTLKLIESSAYAMAAANVLLNNILSLGFCYLGLRLVRFCA